MNSFFLNISDFRYESTNSLIVLIFLVVIIILFALASKFLGNEYYEDDRSYKEDKRVSKKEIKNKEKLLKDHKEEVKRLRKKLKKIEVVVYKDIKKKKSSKKQKIKEDYKVIGIDVESKEVISDLNMTKPKTNINEEVNRKDATVKPEDIIISPRKDKPTIKTIDVDSVKPEDIIIPQKIEKNHTSFSIPLNDDSMTNITFKENGIFTQDDYKLLHSLDFKKLVNGYVCIIQTDGKNTKTRYFEKYNVFNPLKEKFDKYSGDIETIFVKGRTISKKNTILLI